MKKYFKNKKIIQALPSPTFNIESNSSFRKMFQAKNNFVSKLNKDGAGFTLIELIVVIGILSILAAGSLLALNPVAQFQKANDSRRKSDLSQIQKVLEAYFQDNGKYPLSSTATPLYRITVPPGSTTIDWGKPWQPYMNLLPKDPTASKNYVYYSTGQSYYLYASLDRGSSDPGACNGGNACASLTTNGISFNACGGTCNFGVSTPNVTP